ncbi:hypothetical protein STENM327S_05990 [Streptomyces tendae]
MPAGGEREQHVLGALHGGPQGAEQRGSGGGTAAGEEDQVGRGGEPGDLRQRKRAGGLLEEDEVGLRHLTTRARASVSSRSERML